MLNKKIVVLLTLLALTVLAIPVASADTWTGWITDDHCGAKGAKAGHEGCAEKCLGGGAKLVLYNTADEKLYILDNQELAKQHIGHHVKVTGNVEGDAIKVESIAMVEAEPKQ